MPFGYWSEDEITDMRAAAIGELIAHDYSQDPELKALLEEEAQFLASHQAQLE